MLEDNGRARAFYERQGLLATGRRSSLRLGGVVLTELHYGDPAATAWLGAPARASLSSAPPCVRPSWSSMARCMALRARGVSRASA